MPALPPAFLDRPIAHRALHDKSQGRPENSVEAIRAAVEAGYGIEIDLQLSSDGEAMVFHDYDLARLTAVEGPVRTRSAAELGAIPLRYGAAANPEATDYLFSNISQRLAEQIRERVAATPMPDEADGEAAQAALIGELLGWAEAGRFALSEAG